MKHTAKKLLLLAVLLTATATAWAQSRGNLTGRVTDESGSPLPGATVLIKGDYSGYGYRVGRVLYVARDHPGR